ncbi:hypothetical protein BO71DRAFT_428997 [Aspergillus ellipticus CBS 707.79]|uniref:Uncharacterized protein n=1 Tax=Aspergillus ellipticus CBS 707.79 TaxID=1448320 RepID=A0A319DDM8_9EURO|nr:hypothetical protein BO71DRAFT_428997 [Aspergillus ellipticus CBS 707.79]
MYTYKVIEYTRCYSGRDRTQDRPVYGLEEDLIDLGSRPATPKRQEEGALIDLQSIISGSQYSGSYSVTESEIYQRPIPVDFDNEVDLIELYSRPPTPERHEEGILIDIESCPEAPKQPQEQKGCEDDSGSDTSSKSGEIREPLEFEDPMDREELTKLLATAFSEKDRSERPEYYKKLDTSNFGYKVLFGPHPESKAGLLTLIFHAEVNIVSEELCERVGWHIKPYDGPCISAPGMENLVPYGVVSVAWRFPEPDQRSFYQADFYAVKNSRYEIALGAPDMRSLDLCRVDAEIARRLGVVSNGQQLPNTRRLTNRRNSPPLHA